MNDVECILAQRLANRYRAELTPMSDIRRERGQHRLDLVFQAQLHPLWARNAQRSRIPHDFTVAIEKASLRRGLALLFVEAFERGDLSRICEIVHLWQQ